MIDCENVVFSTVATALRDKFKPPLTGKLISVSGDIAAVPASFPAAMGSEMDNSIYERTMTLDGAERHASVMWQWEAVSDKSATKKSECKDIMATIDAQMLGVGFMRMPGSGPIGNADATKYRMVARYRAVISAGESSGENTVYRIYRR